MIKSDNTNILLVTGLIILTSIFRFIPHAPNFTPILSIALISGILFSSKRIGLLIPLSIMLLTDLFLGFHSTLPFVYGSLGIIAFLSFAFKKLDFKSVILGSTASAIIFYLVTNFGVWLTMGLYTKDLSGLLMCYEMALPFFRNTLASTLLFSGFMALAYNMSERYLLKPIKVKENK